MHAFVKIIRNGTQTPAGKVADAEIHFASGALNGLFERDSFAIDTGRRTCRRMRQRSEPRLSKTARPVHVRNSIARKRYL